MAAWLKEAGLAADGGVDKVVEATGVEDGMMYGVALGKQGSTCKSIGEPANFRSRSRPLPPADTRLPHSRCHIQGDGRQRHHPIHLGLLPTGA